MQYGQPLQARLVDAPSALGEPRGDLVVTAPVVFGRLHVLPVVSAFLESYPEVSVGLVLTDRVVHLPDDQVDVALRIGLLPDSSLIASCGAVEAEMPGPETFEQLPQELGVKASTRVRLNDRRKGQKHGADATSCWH